MTDKGYYFPRIDINFPQKDVDSEHKYYSATYFETYYDEVTKQFVHRAFQDCDHCDQRLEAVEEYPCRSNNSECKGGCLEENLIPKS